MQLLVVLFAGWVVLGAACFVMGAGLLRPEPEPEPEPHQKATREPVLPRDRPRLPAPRAAADGRVVSLR